MSATGNNEAWVTLATNDSYALGALVLGTSLKRVGTTRQLVVMVTPGVSSHMRSVLETVFHHIREVNVLDSEDTVNLAILTRPELGITFTKFHCWRLTEFTKCVFLDADTIVIQNADELFDREEFSAAPDSGWPDCFNSGVFVYRPSIETYEKLLTFAMEQGSFDGGDQGLLNSYFSSWSTSDISRHLPFIYNMVSSAVYSYLPAYRVFGQNVKIAHFIGPVKPWLQVLDSTTGQVQPPPGSEHLQALLQAWWDLFRADVHPKLRPEMSGLAGVYAAMSFEGAKTTEQLENEGRLRKHAWEQGNIDYLGKDSFDNILKKIQQTMAQAAIQEPKKKEKSPSPPKSSAKQPTPPPPETSVPAPQPTAEVKETVQLTTTQADTGSSPPVKTQQPVDEPVVTKTQASECVCPPPQPTQTAAAPEVLSGTAPQALITEQVVVKEAQPIAQEPSPPVGSKAEGVPTAQSDVKIGILQPEPTAVISPVQSEIPSAPPTAAILAQPELTRDSAALTSTPAPAKSPEELEEERLSQERAALEKKLGEQMRIAEQKLAEERAAATTAKSKEGQSTPSGSAKPSTASGTGGSSAKASAAEPKAPPRKAPGKGKK